MLVLLVLYFPLNGSCEEVNAQVQFSVLRMREATVDENVLVI